MTTCKCGKDHGDVTKGVFDLMDVCELLQKGQAWQLMKDLGMADDAGDETWRFTEKGAKVAALAMVMNMELVADAMNGEEEKEQWRELMLTNMGMVVQAMAESGYLKEEVGEAMHLLRESAAERLKKRMENPPLQEWVELN